MYQNKDEYKGQLTAARGVISWVWRKEKPIMHLHIVRRPVLVTARFIYFLPDHQNILQEWVHQQNDVLPDFPRLWKLVAFWRREIEGRLKRVEYAYRPIGTTSIRPARFMSTIQ